MVVLSSCTNYDDQFDDLNSQLSTLKTQIDGFTAVSSGVTALQGTVSSLQAAVAALPKSTTPATDISGLQTALTALAATVAELKTSLATAATAADVAALTTSLTKVQTDLSELLAANNVYSDDVIINSNATLSVAKSLGSKLTILNADIIIDQDAAMNATELQSILDVIVTITGNVQYKMVSKSSTVATFSKLTSAGNIYVDVAGAISFPVLENVTALHVDDSHSAYITSFSAPVLSKITTFGAGGASAYASPNVTITTGTANAINLPKATAITLSALATYDAGSLSLTGKLDHTLDIAALTSKTAAGSSLAFSLTSVGAIELSLPLLTKGTVIAATSKTVNLPLFIGSATDSFSGARTLTLGAYTQNLLSSVSLETLNFTGSKVVGASATAVGPNVVLSASTTIASATIAGVVNSVTANFASANTSLSTLALSGKANAVSVSNANGLTELSLGHTAEQSLLASLSVVNNTGITTLSANTVASLKSLTITGNAALTTVSFDALATVGGTAAASVDISNNDLTATKAEITAAATSTTYATGSFTSVSGLKELKAYLDAAVVRYGTAGGTVYASYDTLESYLDIDDVADTNAPFTWGSKGGNAKLEAVYVSNAGYTAASSTGNAIAKRSFVIDIVAANAATMVITANGGQLVSVALNANAALAVNQIVTTASTNAATALGLTLSAAKTARGAASITLGAIGSTSEYSPTTAAAIAQIATNNTFKASDTATLSINGKSITYSSAVASKVVNVFADDLVAAWNAIYTGAKADHILSATTSGTITVTSADKGSDGSNDAISLTWGNTGTASTTNVGFRINTVDTADNSTQPSNSSVLVTLTASTSGSPLSEIGYPALAQSSSAKSVLFSDSLSSLTTTELTTSVGGNSDSQSAAFTATNYYPSDSRADVRNPDGSITTAAVGAKVNHDYTSWL
jgi:hypothetical protein